MGSGLLTFGTGETFGGMWLHHDGSSSAEWCLSSSTLKLVLSSPNSAKCKNVSLCSRLSGASPICTADKFTRNTSYTVFSKQWTNVLGSQTCDNLHCSCQLLCILIFFKSLLSTLLSTILEFIVWKILAIFLPPFIKNLESVYPRHEMSLWILTDGLMMLMNIWGRPRKNGGMFI